MKTLSPALLIVWGLGRRFIFFEDDQMFPMQSMKASNRTFRQIFIYHLKEIYVTMHYVEVSFIFGVIIDIFHLFYIGKWYNAPGKWHVRCSNIISNQCRISKINKLFTELIGTQHIFYLTKYFHFDNFP